MVARAAWHTHSLHGRKHKCRAWQLTTAVPPPHYVVPEPPRTQSHCTDSLCSRTGSSGESVFLPASLHRTAAIPAAGSASQRVARGLLVARELVRSPQAQACHPLPARHPGSLCLVPFRRAPHARLGCLLITQAEAPLDASATCCAQRPRRCAFHERACRRGEAPGAIMLLLHAAQRMRVLRKTLPRLPPVCLLCFVCAEMPAHLCPRTLPCNASYPCVCTRFNLSTGLAGWGVIIDAQDTEPVAANHQQAGQQHPASHLLLQPLGTFST